MTIIIPNIPKLFENQFPKDYQNTFPNWGFFSKEEVEQNKSKLLMLDIDFGRYCSLNCPGCFRKSNVVDDIQAGDMNFEEIVSVIDQALPLGLKSIKICGAGEPTENTRFLEFVREMTKRDVGIAIFTKGQVLGSDDKTAQFYSKYGINSALDLCQELYQLKTSVMLSFQSFDTEVQDALVGKSGHALIRNQALENLVKTGFNSAHRNRLCLTNAPITKANADEVFDIYTYARERNIYPIIAVSMVSGKQLDYEFLKKHDLDEKQKIDLWAKIYAWNIEHGIQTLEQIQAERISAMPGSHPCNQIGYGLYVTLKGEVVRCPGYTKSLGNIRTESLQSIWEKSQQFSGRFNCGCPPKEGITIPNDLYQKVIEELEKAVSSATN